MLMERPGKFPHDYPKNGRSHPRRNFSRDVDKKTSFEILTHVPDYVFPTVAR
jgi:hypothetical protein